MTPGLFYFVVRPKCIPVVPGNVGIVVESVVIKFEKQKISCGPPVGCGQSIFIRNFKYVNLIRLILQLIVFIII